VVRLGYGRSFDIGVFGSVFGHSVTQNLPVLANSNCMHLRILAVYLTSQRVLLLQISLLCQLRESSCFPTRWALVCSRAGFGCLRLTLGMSPCSIRLPL